MGALVSMLSKLGFPFAESRMDIGTPLPKQKPSFQWPERASKRIPSNLIKVFGVTKHHFWA